MYKDLKRFSDSVLSNTKSQQDKVESDSLNNCSADAVSSSIFFIDVKKYKELVKATKATIVNSVFAEVDKGLEKFSDAFLGKVMATLLFVDILPRLPIEARDKITDLDSLVNAVKEYIWLDKEKVISGLSNGYFLNTIVGLYKSKRIGKGEILWWFLMNREEIMALIIHKLVNLYKGIYGVIHTNLLDVEDLKVIEELSQKLLSVISDSGNITVDEAVEGYLEICAKEATVTESEDEVIS